MRNTHYYSCVLRILFSPDMVEMLPGPVIFAHRGASAYAPENTLAAFELAFKQGAPAVEFDVKLTSDAQIVVIHDQTVDRTTDGTGKVKKLPLTTLREFDAGSWFSANGAPPGYFRGEKIPTLDETFETIGKKMFMNVELTNYATPFDQLIPKVVEAVKKHRAEERVLFSSFSPYNLTEAARLLPRVPRGQLILAGNAGVWQRIWGRLSNVQAEHPFLEDVTLNSVADAHAHGRRVHVWTVNAPDDMRRLKSLGVDGIFSDDPLLALQIFINR
jgi:glycerophosphoryl diester phosphodiesterase